MSTPDDDTIARIALALAGVSGEPTVAAGIEALGGAASFVAAVHDGRDAVLLPLLTRQRVRALASVSRVTAVLEQMTCHNITAISPHHRHWPAQVDLLGGAAPLVLFTRGDATVLATPAVAVTGTASPTGFGVHYALELATGLADRGWAIAASAGNGIDQLALGAAHAMRGTTITVTAAILDSDTARVNGAARLGGVWVSELPPTVLMTVRSKRRAQHLLAAIAVKTILVEAGLTAGAVRTAEAAHALGCPVGVVLGPDGSARSAGCRQLAARYRLAPVASIVDADRLR